LFTNRSWTQNNNSPTHKFPEHAKTFIIKLSTQQFSLRTDKHVPQKNSSLFFRKGTHRRRRVATHTTFTLGCNPMCPAASKNSSRI
jgi:hypothetical protein